MELSIRPGEINDSRTIADLSGQLGYSSNEESMKNRLTEILKSVDHCVYVAVDNNKIIGWVHGFYALRVESNPFVEIGGLVVNEAYRNKGVGKMLNAVVSKWAESKDCNSLRLRCNIIRKESHLFYESIGFSLTKVQKVFDKKLG